METGDVASRSESSDVIKPEEYARWRETYLGALTERIEEEAVFQLSGNLGGKCLLDLGCGDGTYSIAAFQRGARVTGVDISDVMLDSARRRAAACGASVEWRQASAESLPYDSGTFDIVLAVTILCFVRDPLQVVREVKRLLRPGGWSVIGELGRYSAWALSRRVRGWLGSSRWRDAHFWTVGELQQLLQQAGFQIGPPRGCVYYPPFNLAAHIIGEHDHNFSFLGQVGAAFLAVRGDNPAFK
ncbi:MAG: class I SAM-dependent methyltransferase [Candidatus Acidiferrales bacterium]